MRCFHCRKRVSRVCMMSYLFLFGLGVGCRIRFIRPYLLHSVFFSVSHCYSFFFRPMRVYKNIPWMPEHTVVPPSSQGSFPVSQQIIVGNLPSDTNEEDLRKFFESKYHLL